MRIYELLNEAIDLDWGDVDDDADTAPTGQQLTLQQQRILGQHQLKRDRLAWRAAERKRRAREDRLYQPDDGGYHDRPGSRHVPKSAVGYRPNKWPMIRFGKFRDRSLIGFDAEMRREMGNATHEAGVSCFKGQPYKGGYLITEHQGRSSWAVGFDEARMLLPWARQHHPQYLRWRADHTPMDIFVVHGHLVSFGANREWLDVGADGEYLLDTRRPYHSENLAPDRLWLSDRQTLEQYYETNRFPARYDD